MMSLEEAITHCEEVADQLEGKDGYAYTDSTCDECAKEHRQLAEWLRELKELRKLIPNRVHPSCAECIHMKEEFAKQPCRNCCNNYISRFEREVKADDT